MKKNLGIFGIAVLAFSLLIISWISSSERRTFPEEWVDTGIIERLNAATGFGWKIIPLSNYRLTETELNLYRSNGYIQQLWPTNQMECLFGVYVFENDDYAKNAVVGEFKVSTGWDDFDDGFIGAIDDPLTNYGIVIVEYGDPCSDAAGSTFDFVFPPKS